jgi:hypothetical protein
VVRHQPASTGAGYAGPGAALVDFKIAAIDETWSGLKFTRRRG